MKSLTSQSVTFQKEESQRSQHMSRSTSFFWGVANDDGKVFSLSGLHCSSLKKVKIHLKLGGGFNPFEKYAGQNGFLPQVSG